MRLASRAPAPTGLATAPVIARLMVDKHLEHVLKDSAFAVCVSKSQFVATVIFNLQSQLNEYTGCPSMTHSLIGKGVKDYVTTIYMSNRYDKFQNQIIKTFCNKE